MFRLLSVLLLLVVSVVAQDEGRALQQFQKAFHHGRKDPPPPLAQRQQALAGLDGIDSARLAETLVAAWLQVEEDLEVLAEERQRNAEATEKLVKGQQVGRLAPAQAQQQLQELVQQAKDLRSADDGLRGLQLQVQQRLQKVARKDALVFLLQKVMLERRYALPLKLACGQALGRGAADVLEDLVAALQRAREVEDLLALVEAFGHAGRAAQLHANPVIALLQHKEEAVRELAAQALARIAVPDAVAPMIEALDQATGQSRLRIGDALDILTGQKFGDNVGAWRAWWAAEGAGVAQGRQPLGQGKPSRSSKRNDNYYFGIPQGQSNAILYVIDCSGSMKAEVDFKRPGNNTVAGANPGKATRLDACKQELVEALGRLRPQQKFGVLWYSDQPHLWEPKMQPASADAVARAQAFVRTLQPGSSTNIHDTMRQALAMVGRGSKDRWYGVELDTIFLLTDGSPTRPDGQLDSTDKILEGVRQWNPLKRVTIHTIGIGKGLNATFLADLARENGGEFKHF